MQKLQHPPIRVRRESPEFNCLEVGPGPLADDFEVSHYVCLERRACFRDLAVRPSMQRRHVIDR
jgi:hypothetical protein